MKTLAITGATGQLGREVMSHLHRLAPAGCRVIACSRNPSHADGAMMGADEWRRADFADRASLLSAFAGVDTLLLVSIEGEDELRIRLHAQAAEAAQRAGVRRIVYTSFFDVAPESPSVVARVHRLTEEAIRNTGCAWTMLRNGPYVDNIAQRIAVAARGDGVFHMAAGSARMPFIARADLALAAAHALLATDSANAAHRLSGPELLSYQQLADLVGAAVGRPVRYAAMDDGAYRDELVGEGLSQALQDRRIAYVQAMRAGFMTALTDDFQTLVGRAPMSMREVVPKLDFSSAAPLH